MKMKGRHTIKEAECTQEFNSSICFNPSLVEDFYQILDPIWIGSTFPFKNITFSSLRLAVQILFSE